MYSVLIVDDERDIRNGLATHLPWEDWGFSHVHVADDGSTALQLTSERHFDLIVTDIRMTRISGLDMIATLKQNGYEGYIIIVSGFDEFQYAKEAIRLGAYDYLLKPVDTDDLRRAVQTVVQKLAERQRQLEYASSQRSNYRQMLPRLREEALQELISRPYRKGQEVRLEYRFEQLDMLWLLNEQLQLAVFEIDDLGALMETQSKGRLDTTMFSVGNILEHFLIERASEKSVVFRSKPGGWVCIWGQQPETPELEQLVKEMSSSVMRFVKISISGKLSQEKTTIVRLHGTYKAAEEGLAYLKATRGLLEYASEAEEALSLADPVCVSEILRYGTEEDLREIMVNYPVMVQAWQVLNPGDLQQHTFEWMLDIFRAAQRAGWRDLDWDKNLIALWEYFAGFDTLESLQEQATVHLLRVSETMKQQFVPQNQVVSEAERYIREHFCEAITLHSVAEQVHVSPAWLSKLFKKETDKNFLEYVTDARLEKAKELLQDLNLKVYHISGIVGYQDTIYFSRLFKRKFGLTPQEYRNNRVNRHDS